MTLVYTYGSGECEQLGLGDDAPNEIKKPRKVSLFELGPAFPARSIIKIVCGGMHTVALSSSGAVYTWGCNDEGALGRFGPENAPSQVGGLKVAVTDVTAGDSHCVAYNTDTNQMYFWGCYRNARTGKTTPKVTKPERFAAELFSDKTKVRVKKVASGQHHTLILSECGKVYGCGDSEFGQIGRNLSTRKKEAANSMSFEKIAAKKAKDIFCGNCHSFYVNKDNQVYAWGLNNHGQLGIGNKFNTTTPTRIKELDPYEGDYIVSIGGSDHHSIALTMMGAVYCWGKNDEGQLGLGDTYGNWRKNKAIKDAEQALKDEEERIEKERLQKEQEAKEAEEKANEQNTEQIVENKEGDQEGGDKPASQIVEDKASQPTKKNKGNRKPKKEKQEKEEDLKYIFYFYRPELVSSLWKLDLEEGDDAAEKQKKVTQIVAAGNYCYAVVESQNEVYSWGFGENYVLGNRDDCNEFKPYKLDPRMFEENKVVMLAGGTQHAVALSRDGSDAPVPVLNTSTFVAGEEVAGPVADEEDIEEEFEQPEVQQIIQAKSSQPAASPIKSQKVEASVKNASQSQHAEVVKSQEAVQEEQKSESKKRSRQEFVEGLEEPNEDQQEEFNDNQSGVKKLKTSQEETNKDADNQDMSNDVQQNGAHVDDEPEPESRKNEPIDEENEEIEQN